MPGPPDERRYHILGRLGEGGFGVVYRARLEGPQGFSKDVAIKLLHDGVPERVVQRFRDEARILGLLRDRAIVAVDQPTLLDGRWAIVMEFVDGASCATLLREEPLPATVAVEVVGEVARALDVAWHQPGPDGEPLHLVHRDLKPANVQLTPTGQVKLLDFGIARARFEAREAHTTAQLAGTPGYMAPERLRGVEGPAGDVYSLGVVLHELITGDRPEKDEAPATFDLEGGPREAVLDLARALRAPDPEARPTAREVEERCEALRRDLEGPTLRRWAEESVPRGEAGTPDAQVGAVLTRTETGTWAGPEPTPTRHAWSWGIGAVGVALGAALLGAWFAAPEPPPPLEVAARQPFLDLVMEIDAQVSERTALRRPEEWDATLYEATVAHMRRMEGQEQLWRRIDQVWLVWGEVVTAVREAGLPEVVAGIPWVESRYTPELQSPMCSKGLWQFMPEVAHRAGPIFGTPMRVADCRFEDDPTALWTPTSYAPPNPLPYLKDGHCRIPQRRGCLFDERTDVHKSTAAVLAILEVPWNDPEFQASGAVVQLTVASHLCGYDDARFDMFRPSNVRPVYDAWAAEYPESEHPRFFGAIAACQADPGCVTMLDPETVDYVARVFAAHFVAMCFYAENYPEHPAFAPWLKYADGYCRSLQVPTRAEVAGVE